MFTKILVNDNTVRTTVREWIVVCCHFNKPKFRILIPKIKTKTKGLFWRLSVKSENCFMDFLYESQEKLDGAVRNYVYGKRYHNHKERIRKVYEGFSFWQIKEKKGFNGKKEGPDHGRWNRCERHKIWKGHIFLHMGSRRLRRVTLCSM